MRQHNITGYPLVVTPSDGSTDPFELAPDETVDYPTPIPGCAADAPEPADDPPAPKAAAKKTTAKTADGGDPA